MNEINKIENAEDKVLNSLFKKQEEQDKRLEAIEKKLVALSVKS
jgi:hypothetical protein